jgi:hypothetical protein
MTDDNLTIASNQGWFFDGLPFVVVIDRGFPNEEKVLCSGIVGNVLVVEQRGYDDTDPAEHAPGASIRHVLSSDVVEEANLHANDHQGDAHAQYLKVEDVLPTSHRHVQMQPEAVWIIIHNLGFRPNATVVDSAGTGVFGDVTYLDSNSLMITFSSPFAGEAYLS